jgi:4-hydroxy-4-methyl-2-oxoglutarate aldolase
MSKTALVVSAHPGDFVWRAGGAIALHARKGYRVKIVCLALGERGESQFAWKQPGMTLDKVKAGRRDEAERAAAVLGAEIEFFDAGDYPLRLMDAHMDRLIDIFRELNPSFVLTHSLEDPYNVDHPAAAAYAQEARIIAQAMGHKPQADYSYSAPPVFLFEPHQPEMCNFKPQVILNIDEVWDIKRKTFEILAAQKHLWAYYERVAARHAGRPQFRQGHDLWRGLSAAVSDGDGGTGMKTVVVSNIKRADAEIVKRLGALGTSTVHEAYGRYGLMKPYLRPVWAGGEAAGTAVTVLVHPGDNWMIHVAVEQCKPGDILVVGCSADNTDGMFGDLLATSLMARGVTGLVIDAGVRDAKSLRQMGFPVWSKAISAKGTVKTTLGAVNVPVVCAGVNVVPGDAVVADDDGVVVIGRKDVGDVVAKGEKRAADEDGKRKLLASGALGLDMYNMREPLAKAGLVYIDEPESD